MRKVLGISCVLLALLMSVPAHAGVNQSGSVLLPTGSPAVARAEFAAGRNGTTGYTFEIPASLDNKAYTLSSLHGDTGREDLDAWFYEDLPGAARGPGNICSPFISQQNGTVESGVICPGSQTAEWVVVDLFIGARSTFVFDA